MKFFMLFCDNNLDTINTLDKPLQQLIEEYEQIRPKVSTPEDLEKLRNELSSIIAELCKTKRAKDKKYLLSLVVCL